jgi:D-arabinose 1-dehydrogenase-like Zn-dependent alcohol dehydrogenase
MFRSRRRFAKRANATWRFLVVRQVSRESKVNRKRKIQPVRQSLRESSANSKREFRQRREVAREMRIAAEIATYPLERVDEALDDLCLGHVQGVAVLVP